MKKVAIIFAIICAVQSVISFAASNYTTASIMLISTAINIHTYVKLRKVM
jgi:hypothetical protein